MNVTRLLPLVGALSLLGVDGLDAQTGPALPPGMEVSLLHSDTNSPWAFNGFAKDPFTEHLYLSVYNQVFKVDAKGVPTLLVSLPYAHATGMIAIPPGSLELFFTNFNTGDFFRHHLLTNKQVKVKGVANSFDVAVTQQGDVLVVANPKWPASGAASGVWLMDLNQGNHREVIQLSGPSGPIVFDAMGNLLYAVQPSSFPAPKGSVRLVRFSQTLVRQAITGTKPVTLSQAAVVMTGLDGALDLAFDDRQRLYISDPQNGGLVRTLPSSMTPDKAFLKPSKLTTLGLQFVERRPATFDGFQPEDGGALYLATTDWVNVTGVWQIRASRPLLSSKPEVRIPKGDLQIRLDKAPAHAIVWLVLSASPPLANETALFYEAGVPGWVGLDLLRPHLVLGGSSDAAGSYHLNLRNPGGASLQLYLQAMAAAGTRPLPLQVGTSNVLSLFLEP